MIYFHGTLHGEEVFCAVSDLDSFMKAGAGDYIFVFYEDGNQSHVDKGDITWTYIEVDNCD